MSGAWTPEERDEFLEEVDRMMYSDVPQRIAERLGLRYDTMRDRIYAWGPPKLLRKLDRENARYKECA